MPGKIDAEVFRELDRLAEELSRGEQARVPVLIEHVTPATEIPADPELRGGTRDLLAGIVKALHELAAQDVEPRSLASVVSARLTREQVNAMARRADVRRIQLSRARPVTLY